ncbi:IclR family transcriptional regulator [Pseudomonas sp. CFBP 8771]|uniref:IclR family transcriptional regulator n=1 Tax=Pseudomonas baltica TaxID=2762576 RepID=A0A7X1KSF7_9PSED|nr:MULTISPECIES: IclR family transcriptional regulator [Pseudomonas]MBC2677594.1 IclR family transcriptional regulator [Pseudomonas baltica]MBD8601457.1 IclR family transcriptional regulator [Pseudomonas sp. CFBP 8771]MBD8825377.1 IclR family transcriptional regulator [Pseudomonas sp. CFBP 13602]
MSSDNDRNGIQVISRAAAILRCLESEPDGLSLGAIAKRIELPRSTVQRLVDALAHEELLKVHGAGGVCLGPALMRLASNSHVDIIQQVRPYMEALTERTGETSVLVNRNGTHLMLLHSVVSPQPLRVAPSSGSFLSVYATSGGKALLAKMSDEAVVQLLGPVLEPLTPSTPDLPHLLEQLAEVRVRDYACDANEHMMGVGAVAVALQTSQGQYALALVGPVWRVEAQHEVFRQALFDTRQALTRALGAGLRTGETSSI